MLKTISNDEKIVVELKLKTTNSKNIYRSVCFDILNTISYCSIEKYKHEYFSGYEIPLGKFINISGCCYEVINRHIEWLLENEIIWRSKLSYTKINNVFKYDIYRYDIHRNMETTTLQRFIYKTVEETNFTDIIPKDYKLKKIYDVLKLMSVDIEGALEVLLDSDKKNKIQQARALYNIYINTHNVDYGENVNRVFHTVTGLSSCLHDFLYINGYKLCELDAKQSQLTLISNLTRHVKSDFHKIIDNGSFYEHLVNFFKYELKQNECLNGSDGCLSWFDVDSNRREYCHWTKLNKQTIKPMVYAALFSGFTNGSEISKYMRTVFSEVIEEFYKIVGEDSAAKFLQNLEAVIWIEACIELIDSGILCLPKHDSLLFRFENLDEVRRVIDKHMKKNGINHYSLNDAVIRTNDIKFVQPDLKFEVINNSTMREIQKEVKTDVSDKTIFKFKKEGVVWEGTKTNFCNSFNLDKKNLNKVIKEDKKTIKGWSL